MDDFEENVNSQEFMSFVETLVGLNLHMVLNDPPI